MNTKTLNIKPNRFLKDGEGFRTLFKFYFNEASELTKEQKLLIYTQTPKGMLSIDGGEDKSKNDYIVLEGDAIEDLDYTKVSRRMERIDWRAK